VLTKCGQKITKERHEEKMARRKGANIEEGKRQIVSSQVKGLGDEVVIGSGKEAILISDHVVQDITSAYLTAVDKKTGKTLAETLVEKNLEVALNNPQGIGDIIKLQKLLEKSNGNNNKKDAEKKKDDDEDLLIDLGGEKRDG
jgi:hypothetical protein